jgi:hypothetical protein
MNKHEWKIETGTNGTSNTPPSAAARARQHTRPSSLCVAAVVLLLGLRTAGAQSYTIDWFTMDGGGGTSTGGVYQVNGTIGQPYAGRAISGGNYSLTSGFWSLFSVVQTPGAPRLAITLTSTNTAIVSWPSTATGFTLQQNTSVIDTMNWSNVVTTPIEDGLFQYIIVHPGTGHRFYRLFKP